MKVYYSDENETVRIEGLERFFNTSLVAEEVEGIIGVRDQNNSHFEVVDEYTSFEKENGDPAGTNNSETIAYLNQEFSKRKESGEATFVDVNTTLVVNVFSGKSNSRYIITPITGTLNELVWVSEVSEGQFTIKRAVIAALGLITSNLKINWKRIK